MALAITRAITETFDPNFTDNTGGFGVLQGSQNNLPAALRRLLPLPTFTTECTTTGSETTVIANTICTLGALGVSFPLGALRLVRVRAYSRITTANGGMVERWFAFRGAATLGTVTQPADGTVMGTAVTTFAVPVALRFDGTNFGMPQAGIDATAGPFITIFSTAVGDTGTAATVNARHAVEIYVEPLIVLPAF